HIVASRGDLLKVIRLYEYGADPNIKDLDGNTVLHVAVVANKIDIVRCLLEHGANGDIKNTGGSTPIELATLPHQKDIQNLLSTNG
ncbi:ankyrin repeat domain-containing protein 26-like, partial [Trifolium medium]|nr:ankyrin repeat domain-containing protein 26-like [Trifolium medium]